MLPRNDRFRPTIGECLGIPERIRLLAAITNRHRVPDSPRDAGAFGGTPYMLSVNVRELLSLLW